jgi:hypothetical protein
MAGIKISQLNSGGNVTEADDVAVARGSETYKIKLKQFVTTAENIGVGNNTGQVFFNESETSSTSLIFRSLKGGDNIDIQNGGDTVIIATSAQNPVKNKFFGNGATTVFTLTGTNSTNVNNYRVDINGILLEPNRDFFVNGSQITFTTPPISASKIVVVSNNLIKTVDLASIVLISDTPPENPSLGTLWYDSSAGDCSLYYNNDGTFQWVNIGGNNTTIVDVSDTQPTNAVTGSLWFNNNNNVLSVCNKIGNTTNWVDVGLSALNTFRPVNSSNVSLSWNGATRVLSADIINYSSSATPNSFVKRDSGGAFSGSKLLLTGSTNVADIEPELRITGSGSTGIFDFHSRLAQAQFTPLVQNNDKAIIYGSESGLKNTGSLVIGQYSDFFRGIRLTPDGKIGLGVAAPAEPVEVMGNLKVFGDVLATGVKSFLIDHPILPNSQLRHIATESPTPDLIYRGVTKLNNGQSTINIDNVYNMTQGTVNALAMNLVVVSLQNQTSFERVKPSQIINGEFNILCENSSSSDEIAWVVMGTRKDIPLPPIEINK